MSEVGQGSRLPDLVYPVRRAGEELRYSLRSVAANAEGLFGRVWLVGDRPEWVQGVGHIAAGNPVSRGEDVRAKIAAACVHPDVAESFILMNDDYFLVEPIDRWRAWHMGPSAERIAALQRDPTTSAGWLKYVIQTRQWVSEQRSGVAGMYWQGHRPLLWDKAKFGETLDAYPSRRPLDVVGLYELAGAEQEHAGYGYNTKVKAESASFHAKLAERADVPWLSSSDRSFAEGMIGGYIRGMFPTPCRFEVTA